MKNRIFARIDDAVRKIAPRRLFWSIVVINIALVALVLASTLAPRRARISAEAETEIAIIELPAGQSLPAWGELALGPSPVNPRSGGCLEPALDLREPVEGPLSVRLKIVPATGMLSITLTREHGNVGSIKCADGRTFDSGPSVNLLRPKSPERSLVLPFTGIVTIGDLSEGSASMSILRSGTITVEASSYPFRNGAVRTETRLYPGDIVQLFRSHSTGDPAVSNGLLMVGDEGLIKVVAHSDAREARVIHVGQVEASATSVAPTFWAKVQAQSEWTLLLLLGALILNIVGALHRYRVEAATGQPSEGPDT